MDDATFDRIARFLGTASSRRFPVLAALGAALLWRSPDDIVAGPGCKDVGTPCRRKGDCCSNVCRGKRDKKKCKAHDTGGCEAGATEDFCGGVDVACTTSSGLPGRCNTTTGDAAYCARDGDCDLLCTTDRECQQQLGAGAACVTCATCPSGRACASPRVIP